MGAITITQTPCATVLSGFCGIQIRPNTIESARAFGWEDGYFGREKLEGYADRSLSIEYHKSYTLGNLDRSYN